MNSVRTPLATQEIEVKVFYGGRHLKTILRPVRQVGSQLAVKYKGKLYALRIRSIDLSESPLLEESCASEDQSESPQSSPAIEQEQPAAPVVSVPSAWDDDQMAVITADGSARIVVDAGPGTGKTAVACRRVAELIDSQQIVPANIWFVSFTRTAVQEIRTRLGAYLRTPADAYAIRIATIDSHAWAIQTGFDSNASLSGSYEDSIERVTDMVKNNEGVFEYLESLEHLLIDEAQDVVGVRARFIEAILKRLRPECGVTIFADEAQAIYGFADEDGGSRAATGHLPERLRKSAGVRFEKRCLHRVHRASNDNLRTIFTDVRARVLQAGSSAGATKFDEVRHSIGQLADSASANIDDAIDLSFGSSTFVLFRSRAHALLASAYQQLKPHRLRMSGLPVAMEPWLAVVLWDFTSGRLTETHFSDLWEKRIAGRLWAGWSLETAWKHLVRLAGETHSTVAMPILRSKLGRSAPPPELCAADFGTVGPVFGTIHGCKGREADQVLLMMPRALSIGTDADEEARVMFVGATRARRRLVTLAPYRSGKSRVLTSGRAIILHAPKCAAQVEIGRDGDLKVEGIVGRQLGDARAVERSQRWLSEHTRTVLFASAEMDQQFRYVVRPGDSDLPIVTLSENVASDLFEAGLFVGKEMSASPRLRAVGRLSNLRIFGSRTLVTPPGVDRSSLHEPWSSSGFMLAPLVQGLVMSYYRAY